MSPVGRSLLLWLVLSSSTAVGWSAPRKPTEHVVQSGQTLAKIAKRYNLSIDELCEANDLKRSATLKLGQRLALPSDEDDERSNTSRSRQSDSTERSVASVGRANNSTQNLAQLRHGSFSRYLGPPAKRGWVHVMGFHGEYKGQLLSKSGKLMPKAAIALSRILAWPKTDFVMDRRLLTLLAKVSDAFGGRTLRAVSGYRTTSFVSESKHPLGRACDFSVLGVPNAALRDYVRTFTDVGVGYYPNSSFVHLDVRDYDAYWIDYAGPGEAPRARPEAVAKKVNRNELESDSAVAQRRDGPDSDRTPTEREPKDDDRAEQPLATAPAERETTDRATSPTTGRSTEDAPTTEHSEPEPARRSGDDRTDAAPAAAEIN